MLMRTTIIAGGLLGLGIFTAAPAMAGPGMDVRCSPPSICPVITTWQNGLAQAGSVWAGAPAQVAKVWHDATVGP